MPPENRLFLHQFAPMDSIEMVTITNWIESGTSPRYDVCSGSPEEIAATLRRWRDAHGNDLLDMRVRFGERDEPALEWLERQP